MQQYKSTHKICNNISVHTRYSTIWVIHTRYGTIGESTRDTQQHEWYTQDLQQ